MKCLKDNVLWWMLGFVMAMYLLNLSMIFFVKDKDVRGTFGDQFGAVNALFSGLAFAGLIYTIILQRRDLALQRKDLALQRKELELTRDELKNQTEQQEEQNKILRIQRFENTFFQMLAQFQEIVNNISFSYVDIKKEVHRVQGRQSFRDSFESAALVPEKTDWHPRMRNQPYIGMRDIIKNLGYDGYVDSVVPTYFDHYFRFLYRILKYIYSSPLVTSYEEEYEYTCMLRAMLSRYELVWLYYNGLSYGKEKLKPLIERYAMLNNLRNDLLVGNNDVFGTYDISAFQKCCS